MGNILKKIKRTLLSGTDTRGNLLKKMPKNAVCAEIGTWKGGFSERILEITQPKKLYLIDPFKFFGEYKKAKFGGRAESQETMDELFNKVSNRFSNQISSGQVEILRESSADGLSKILDNTLDWIYIDGNHTYEYVKEDLVNSWNKIKINGFICCDDYGLEGWWDNGVTRAVDEFVEEKKQQVKVISIDKTQYIFQKLKN